MEAGRLDLWSLAATVMTEKHEDDELLIRAWIQPDPHRPGTADARIEPYGVSVWAVIGYLLATAQFKVTGTATPEKRPPLRELEEILPNLIESVALDYEIPIEAVAAALAYFRRYPRAILARIALNDRVPFTLPR